jgi:hypothetical protein
MKKPVFFLVVLALLCFAMPAIASPPPGLPALEASGPIASTAYTFPTQEVAPFVAVAPGSLEGANFVSASALKASVLLVAIFATVAMLAGLMHAASSASHRLGINRGRGIANGAAGGRRWV